LRLDKTPNLGVHQTGSSSNVGQATHPTGKIYSSVCFGVNRHNRSDIPGSLRDSSDEHEERSIIKWRRPCMYPLLVVIPAKLWLCDYNCSKHTPARRPSLNLA